MGLLSFIRSDASKLTTVESYILEFEVLEFFKYPSELAAGFSNLFLFAIMQYLLSE